MGQIAAVTGATGGLGRATVERLVQSGWTVLALDLPSDALTELGDRPGVVAIPLDVTDSPSVAAAAAAIEAQTDHLDGIVNFAGILVVGSMFEVPEDDFARLMEINLMGTYRVNRALFGLVQRAGGRIVNISSETGWQEAMPFNGPYAISKHAIEAYSDAMRREADLVGVHVIKVQPGPFRTGMTAGITAAFERAAEGSEQFGGLLRRMGRAAVREFEGARDPSVLAEVIHEALTDPRPSPAYSVHPARSRVVLDRLPRPVSDRLIGAAMRRFNRS